MSCELPAAVHVGSSLGGFLAVAVAVPTQARGLFLMAPAFELPGLPPTPLCDKCPTTVVHGWNDDIVPVEIGILAGFGGRTTDMGTLTAKGRLAAARVHGVIYFYWEGLWGKHAGREGAAMRQAAFRQLHRSLSSLPSQPPPLHRR